MFKTILRSRMNLNRLVVLLVMFTVPISIAVTQSQPRVGIAPLLNLSRDPESSALAATVTRTIAVNLNLLGGYEIMELDTPLENTSPAHLASVTTQSEYDSIVFGTIERSDTRTTEFRVGLYDSTAEAIVFDNNWRITSVFEVFDTADLIVETMLGLFATERITFGQLVINNRGSRGDYRVYVNESFLGENLTQSRILAGTYRVRVEQDRMFGTYIVTDEVVVVPEDATGTVRINVPGLTEREERRLIGFQERIDTRGHPDRSEFDFQGIINDYIALARDLEDAAYSAEINRRKSEIEAVFNDFVTWYSQPVPSPEDPASNGLLQIIAQSGGELWVDGESKGVVVAGIPFTVRDVGPGERTVEIHYDDGERAIQTAVARFGETVKATFEQPDSVTYEYAIGDVCPAGGIVFFDNGGGEGGWRYLSAAPEDRWARGRVSFQWGGAGRIVGAREDGVGSGRMNTDRTIDLLGAGSYASRVADVTQINRYSDWFLPSLAELDLMYRHRDKIGGFSAAFYWSSTEADGDTAWGWLFGAEGQAERMPKESLHRVRAIRAF